MIIMKIYSSFNTSHNSTFPNDYLMDIIQRKHICSHLLLVNAHITFIPIPLAKARQNCKEVGNENDYHMLRRRTIRMFMIAKRLSLYVKKCK